MLQANALKMALEAMKISANVYTTGTHSQRRQISKLVIHFDMNFLVLDFLLVSLKLFFFSCTYSYETIEKPCS